jgi:hypothetical protein
MVWKLTQSTRLNYFLAAASMASIVIAGSRLREGLERRGEGRRFPAARNYWSEVSRLVKFGADVGQSGGEFAGQLDGSIDPLFPRDFAIF